MGAKRPESLVILKSIQIQIIGRKILSLITSGSQSHQFFFAPNGSDPQPIKDPKTSSPSSQPRQLFHLSAPENNKM